MVAVTSATGPMNPVNGNESGRAIMRRADGKPIHVLVVDDEPVLAELVSMALRYEGWDIATAGDGATAITLARENPPDVVVLDVMLPDMSGLDVLHKLCQQIPGLPLLLLTAKDSVEDRIAGLTAGGDDYVTKPFSLEEVVLRLRALLRRTGVTTETGGAKIVVGDLVLDEDSHEVTRGGDLISLTATEFELLRFMMRNSKRVLSKAQILDRVWSYDFGGRSNIVELYVSYLRKKIDSGRQPMIHTLRGAGYVLKPPRWFLRRGHAYPGPADMVVAGAVTCHSGSAAGIGVRGHRSWHRACVATLSDESARRSAR
jgi:two-component system, OmpR family, response regulator